MVSVVLNICIFLFYWSKIVFLKWFASLCFLTEAAQWPSLQIISFDLFSMIPFFPVNLFISVQCCFILAFIECILFYSIVSACISLLNSHIILSPLPFCFLCAFPPLVPKDFISIHSVETQHKSDWVSVHWFSQTCVSGLWAFHVTLSRSASQMVLLQEPHFTMAVYNYKISEVFSPI